MQEVVEDAHLRQRQYFVSVERDDTGPLTYPGAPYRFSQTPWAIRRPAPRLGEHNDEVYAGCLGVSRQELLSLTQMGIV
jgi:CoA:oxalate CoA-transferase